MMKIATKSYMSAHSCHVRDSQANAFCYFTIQLFIIFISNMYRSMLIVYMCTSVSTLHSFIAHYGHDIFMLLIIVYKDKYNKQHRTIMVIIR